MNLRLAIMTIVVTISGVHSLNYRLENTTIPYHYDMDLEVRLEPEFRFSGNVSIDVLLQHPTNVIILHIDRLEIDKMNSFLLDKIRNKVHYFRMESYDNVTHFLTLRFEEKLSDGVYTLRFQYQGDISKGNSGLYRTFYKPDVNSTRWFAVTQFEPIGARRMFPCFDEPQFKATFELRVVHPRDRHAISNMEVTNIMHVDKKSMTSFRRSPVMSTYLLALAVTDYDHIESIQNGDKYRIFAETKMINYTEVAQEITLKSVSILEEILGVDYSMRKLDQIVVPVFPGGMENWGMIVYGDGIYFQPNKTTDRKKENILNLICHEVAHQWFGNLVTLKWWSYTWLNEGFATYYGHICAQWIEPERRLMDKHIVQEIRRIMHTDSQLDMSKSLNQYVEKNSQIDKKFDSFSYTKGSAVIRFIASSFKNFNISITNYLIENAYAPATPDDLYRAIQFSNSFPPKTNASEILSTWTDQPGYPVVTLNIDYEKNAGTFTQKRFVLVDGEKSVERWWIPITISSERILNFNNFTPIEWIRPEDDTTEVKLVDTTGWTIVNNQQTSYCRVNYDLVNWRKIVKYLNESDQESKIHYLNRAQLVDDSMNLARAGLLPYEIALDLSTYLEREKDPIVWYSAFPTFGFLNNVLYGTDLHQKLNVYVANMINKSLQQSAQLRTIDKEMKLDRDYVAEFSKKFNKIKSKTWKGKRKQLTKTFAILSENIFTKVDFEKVEKLFTTKIDAMDEIETEISKQTLNKIDQNILYKQYWIERYYKEVAEWFKRFD